MKWSFVVENVNMISRIPNTYDSIVIMATLFVVLTIDFPIGVNNSMELVDFVEEFTLYLIYLFCCRKHLMILHCICMVSSVDYCLDPSMQRKPLSPRRWSSFV